MKETNRIGTVKSLTSIQSIACSEKKKKQVIKKYGCFRFVTGVPPTHHPFLGGIFGVPPLMETTIWMFRMSSAPCGAAWSTRGLELQPGRDTLGSKGMWSEFETIPMVLTMCFKHI